VIQQRALIVGIRQLLSDELRGPTRAIARPSEILINRLPIIGFRSLVRHNGGRRLRRRKIIVRFAIVLRLLAELRSHRTQELSYLICNHRNALGLVRVVEIRRQALDTC
jgi:hypothetical protein